MAVYDSENVLVCSSCRTVIPENAKFCPGCGASRDLSVTPTVKHDEAITQPSTTSIASPPISETAAETKSRKKIWASLIVTALVVGGLLYISQPKFDYEATNLKQFVLDNSTREREVVMDTCNSFQNLVTSRYNNLSEVSSTLDYTYTYALGETTDYFYETSEEFKTWGENQLAGILGADWEKAEKPELIVDSLLNVAGTYCGTTVNYSALISLASDVDTRFTNINNPPYNWEGFNFYQSDQDPNLAYRWTDKSNYSCYGYYNGCIAVDFKIYRSCSYVEVEFGLSSYSGGPIFDTVTEFVYSVTKNQYVTEKFESPYSGTNWWRVNSLTCEG